MMRDTEVEQQGIRLSWCPTDRVARFRTERDDVYTGAAADALIPVVATWADGRPYGILVDASNVDSAGSEWRMKWAHHHDREGDLVRIAIVNANLFVRTLLYSYARVTGRSLRTFRTEDEAVAWLRTVVPTP